MSVKTTLLGCYGSVLGKELLKSRAKANTGIMYNDLRQLAPIGVTFDDEQGMIE